MFRVRYSLAEVARMMRKSEQALIRDIRMGRLKVQGGIKAKRRGGDSFDGIEIELNELKHYLGPRRTNRLLGKPSEEEVLERKGIVFARVKKCRICGQLKSITEFTRDGRFSDWLSPDCDECLGRSPYGRRRF